MLIGWLLTISLSAAPSEPQQIQRFESTERHMGCDFIIVAYSADKQVAKRAMGAAFARVKQLDQMMSDYNSESELSRLSRSSPTVNPAKVSRDLWRVLVHAQRVSNGTDGAFDVTVGPLTRLWRRARRQKKMPTSPRLNEARAAVGYKFVVLDHDKQTVSLTRPNMRLDLGGIAKGYAADEALAALRKHGIRRAMVNASGDIAMGDAPPDKTGWKIGVAPLDAGAPPSRFLLLANCAVATSGDAWQFVEIDGKRFSHIVDPRTGLGLTDHSSVTIVAPNCTTADTLASAVSVLGPRAGISLVEKTPRAAAYIVRAPDGKLEIHQSKRFATLPAAPKE